MMTTEVRVAERPQHPMPIRILNSVGRGLDRWGIVPVKLTRDALMKKAMKKTGLSDFGDDGFVEGLDRFLESLHAEARATMLGKIVAEGDLLNNLMVRLQIIEWRKRHPEVADEEVRAPLLINGLPRTGTTILHGLLDVDPANRSPLTWEVDAPIPPPTPATWSSDPRIAEAQKKFDNFNRLAPGLEAVHPMGALMPQECVVVFTRDFHSEQFTTMFEVPSYVEWLDEADMSATYAWHKEYLQHLQSGGVRGERWLLKSPCHLHLLDDIFATYPDANIIHTHRNPLDVVASVSSLFALLRGISSDHVDRRHIGRQQLDWWEKLLGVAMAQRDRHADKPAQFIDVRMQETVGDPLGVVERIYDHFGYELRPRVKRDMERFLADNSRDKHGSHAYRASDFGIDPAKEAHRFAAYRERYGV